ncbi:MAG: LysR family transcriptional regulator [Candidatus Symbiobacter sp.]|nr:LysR family transcriptional regulator [Candidatus Symbiobacter sp.]
MRSDEFPFDLWALQIFLTVCETGSMASASRDLGLTQPAVTQSIADIEARLGTKLFDRSVRPIVLTQGGEILRQRANFLLTEARQIAPMLRDVTNSRLASLRVGMVDSLMRCLLPNLSQRLSEMAEQVAVFSGLTASHANALFTRRLDIVLGVEDSVDIDGLERWSLITEPYFLVMPKHLTPPDSVNGLTDFAHTHELVRFSARSHTGSDIDRHLRRLRINVPRHTEFDSPYGVLSRVHAGCGYAIITPLCLLEANFGLDNFHCAPLPGPNFRRHLTLVARRQELGTIPQELANMARKLILESVENRLMPHVPWMTPALFDQNAPAA